MRKIIILLALSSSLMTSSASAKELVKQPSLLFKNSRTMYIRHYLGYGYHMPQNVGTHAVTTSKINSNDATTDVSDITQLFNIDLASIVNNANTKAGKLLDNIDPVTLQMKESLEVGFNINRVLSMGMDTGGYLNDYFGLAGEIGYHHLQDSKFQYSLKGSISDTQVMSINHTITGSMGIISGMIKPTINIINLPSCSIYVTSGIGFSYVMPYNNIIVSTNGECNTDKLMDIITAPSSVVESISTNINEEVQSFVDNHQSKITKTFKNNRRLSNKYSMSTEAWQISWMLGAGLMINISNSIKLDIGYSYKSLANIQTPKIYQEMIKDAIKDVSIYCHTAHFGVRVYF